MVPDQSINVMFSQSIPKMDEGTEGFPVFDSTAYLHTTFMGHLHGFNGLFHLSPCLVFSSFLKISHTSV